MNLDTTLRPAVATDGGFLAAILMEAFNWDPERPPKSLEEMLAAPQIAHYVVGWPLPGDVGVVAEILGHPVGGAWVRLFTRADRGFGYVADDIPELSIAVVSGHRGDGIGTSLMHTLEIAASAAGYHSISLSTERSNYAHDWYTKLGYRVVANDRQSDIMLKQISPAVGPAFVVE